MTEQKAYENALNGLKNADVKIDDEIRYPAIKAIEKQIPKKPVDKIMYLECPACEDVGILDCAYCSVCGQKLDWSDEE